MENTYSIEINAQRDIARLRQKSRELLGELKAPLRDQSRISWICDFLARRMMFFYRGGIITLSKIEKDNKQGVAVSCSGAWLRPMGHLYEQRAIPMLSASDDVEYSKQGEFELRITLWAGGKK